MAMKRSWHSDADLPYRRRILQEIHNFFTLCPQVSQTAEWMSTFPGFLRRLELTLYLNADCREEYADSRTVVDRLRAVTLHLQRQRVEQMRRVASCGGAPPSSAAGPTGATSTFRQSGTPPVNAVAGPGCPGDLRPGSAGQLGPASLDSRGPIFSGIEISREDIASEGGVQPSVLYGSVPRGVGAAQAAQGGYVAPPAVLMGEIASCGVVPRPVPALAANPGSGDLRRSLSLSEAYKYAPAGVGDVRGVGYAGHFHSAGQGVLAGRGAVFGRGHCVPGLEGSELRFVRMPDVGGADVTALGSRTPGLGGLEAGSLHRSSQPGFFDGQSDPCLRSRGTGGFVTATNQGRGRCMGGMGHLALNAGSQLGRGPPALVARGMEGSLLGEQRTMPLKVAGTYPMAPTAEGFDPETGKLIRSMSASGALSPR